MQHHHQPLPSVRRHSVSVLVMQRLLSVLQIQPLHLVLLLHLVLRLLLVLEFLRAVLRLTLASRLGLHSALVPLRLLLRSVLRRRPRRVLSVDFLLLRSRLVLLEAAAVLVPSVEHRRLLSASAQWAVHEPGFAEQGWRRRSTWMRPRSA
jgi:hypothetical protein